MIGRPGKPALLEVTLRDGSYAIDFQFTAADTATLCAELEGAGIDLIEIGHGIGLGASEAGHGRAAETDETYMRAAADTLRRAKWGMFCIPGIASLEHVDRAAEFGMNFIRIGTNVNTVEQSEPFIARARKRGMRVTSNFMKSYATEPKEFAEKAALSQRFGSEAVYVVDSAGGMLPVDVDRYFQAVRDRCDIPLGFHGHNNLGLAVANSMRAVELGAAIVDTSLQGIGRSAGNTPTELFVAVMERVGIRMGIQPLQVMDIGEKFVRPLLGPSGWDSMDTISGYSQFHSSYMGVIREFSSKYRIDPRRLIMALCEENKVDAPRALLDRIAREISQEGEEVFTGRFRFDRYHGAEQIEH
jgi:4-hydroxy 2-oxovalerate aldolase